MNEQFSAFLDGEARRDEADAAIHALLNDHRLRESWGRQHWLRTTLRAPAGEASPALDSDFSSRVMTAIAQDRVDSGVPDPIPMPASSSGRVVPLRARAARRWRSMAGLAAVASAAGVVLLVSNPVQRDGMPMDTAADGAIASTATAPAGAAGDTTRMVASNTLSSDLLGQAGPSAAAVQRGPADHWSVSDPALEDELNGYLVEHNGLARGYGMSGTTPGFVRVATYGQETPR